MELGKLSDLGPGFVRAFVRPSRVVHLPAPAASKWTLIDRIPDPGNPGFNLSLWDHPDHGRTIVVFDAASHRKFEIQVEPSVTTARWAAASTFGLDAGEYDPARAT